MFCWRSGSLFGAEGYYGVDAGGTAGWDVACYETAEQEYKGYGESDQDIGFVELQRQE